MSKTKEEILDETLKKHEWKYHGLLPFNIIYESMEAYASQSPSPAEDRACPCLYLDEPCHPRCACVIGGSSSGCAYCCTYGSLEQRKEQAKRLELKLKSPSPAAWVNGLRLIADERKRQIEVEKWDYQHDEDYKDGQLIGAAGCYIANALSKLLEDKWHTNQSPLSRFELYSFAEYKNKKGEMQRMGWTDAWPWDKKWDKRIKHDYLRSLVIAGALIAAEIDRLQPESKPESPEAEGEAVAGISLGTIDTS